MPVLQVRLSQEEYDSLKDRASAADQTVSDLVRDWIAGTSTDSTVAPAPPPPTPERAPVPHPIARVVELPTLPPRDLGFVDPSLEARRAERKRWSELQGKLAKVRERK